MKINKLLFFFILITLGILILLIPYIEDKKTKAFERMALVLSGDVLDSLDYIEEDIEPEPEISEPDPEKPSNKPTVVEKYLGILEIKKINLKKGFYNKNSSLNHVNKNVTILKESNYPDEEKGNVILVAHNGTTSRAYFKKLDQLSLGDEATITYKDKKYTYRLVNTYLQQKTGTVKIYRDSSKEVLTLITCTTNSKTTQTVYIFERI